MHSHLTGKTDDGGSAGTDGCSTHNTSVGIRRGKWDSDGATARWAELTDEFGTTLYAEAKKIMGPLDGISKIHVETAYNRLLKRDGRLRDICGTLGGLLSGICGGAAVGGQLNGYVFAGGGLGLTLLTVNLWAIVRT